MKQIGKLQVELGKELTVPKMVSLSRTGGRYFLSFCYDDGKKVPKQREVYQELKNLGFKNVLFLGVDRGIKVQSACSDESTHSFTQAEMLRLEQKELKKKKFQRKLARQKKGSQNRKKTVKKLSKVSAKSAFIKQNFNHHVSKRIVNSKAQVLVYEDLKLKNMTRSASGTQEEPGRNVAAKSGLNRALLNCNLGQQFDFVKYKAIRRGKLVLKVNPKGSSIECCQCNHSDPNNRLTQEEFRCLRCGHTENADIQAAKNIAQRGLLDFVSGKVEFLDEPKKKVRTARRMRDYACGEDIRRASQRAELATSMKQEPESSKPSANLA